jgi:hypothetical protein
MTSYRRFVIDLGGHIRENCADDVAAARNAGPVWHLDQRFAALTRGRRDAA